MCHGIYHTESLSGHETHGPNVMNLFYLNHFKIVKLFNDQERDIRFVSLRVGTVIPSDQEPRGITVPTLREINLISPKIGSLIMILTYLFVLQGDDKIVVLLS